LARESSGMGNSARAVTFFIRIRHFSLDFCHAIAYNERVEKLAETSFRHFFAKGD